VFTYHNILGELPFQTLPSGKALWKGIKPRLDHAGPMRFLREFRSKILDLNKHKTDEKHVLACLLKRIRESLRNRKNRGTHEPWNRPPFYLHLHQTCCKLLWLKNGRQILRPSATLAFVRGSKPKLIESELAEYRNHFVEYSFFREFSSPWMGNAEERHIGAVKENRFVRQNPVWASSDVF
jgi:hypothetical protein